MAEVFIKYKWFIFVLILCWSFALVGRLYVEQAHASEVYAGGQNHAGSVLYSSTSTPFGQVFYQTQNNITDFNSFGTSTAGVQIDCQLYEGDYLNGSVIRLIATTTAFSYGPDVIKCDYGIIPTKINTYYSNLFIPQSGNTYQFYYQAGGSYYSGGYSWTNSSALNYDLYFSWFYENAPSGNIEVLSPVDGSVWDTQRIWFNGRVSGYVTSISIWADNLTTGDSYLIHNQQAVQDKLADYNANYYEWLSQIELPASSTYRVRYITGFSNNTITSTSSFSITPEALSRTVNYISAFGSTSPVLDVSNFSQTEVCEGIDTTTFFGAIECGFKKVIAWTFYPSNMTLNAISDSVDTVQTKFPLSVYNDFEGLWLQGGTTNISTTSSSTAFRIPLRWAGQDTGKDLFNASMIPSKMPYHSTIYDTIKYLMYLYTCWIMLRYVLKPDKTE